MYFKISNQEGEKILHCLTKELHCHDNLDRAFRTLKSVLGALRNCLPFQKSLDLLNVLPLSLKSMYLDHWTVPRKSSRPEIDLDELIAEARKIDKHSSIQDFTTHDEAQQAIYAVFRVIGRYIDKDEIKLMVDVLA